MELRQALDGSDLAEIKARTDALQEASHKLAESVYAAANTPTAAPSGDGGAPSDDEVVEEADYEVIDEDEAAKKA